MTRKMFVLGLAGAAALACQSSGMRNTRTASNAPPRTDQAGARADAGSPTAGGSTAQPGQAGASVGASDTGAQASGSMSSSGAYGSAGTSGMSASAGTSDVKGHPSDQVVSGSVQKVSGDAITIASQDGTPKQLKVSEATLVEIDGQQGKATDIKEGQQVRASFNQVDGEDVAVKIVSGSAGSSSSSGSSWGSGSSGTGSSSTGTANQPPPTTGSKKADVTNTPSDVSRGSTTGVEKPGKSPQDEDATKPQR
jgi:Cu/Ag efflux protein CusF